MNKNQKKQKQTLKIHQISTKNGIILYKCEIPLINSNNSIKSTKINNIIIKHDLNIKNLSKFSINSEFKNKEEYDFLCEKFRNLVLNFDENENALDYSDSNDANVVVTENKTKNKINVTLSNNTKSTKNSTTNKILSNIQSISFYFYPKIKITKEILTPHIQKLSQHLQKRNTSFLTTNYITELIQQEIEGISYPLLFIPSLIKLKSKEIIEKLLYETNLSLINTKKPFVVCFVGVNGVGKTTNLSKFCFWLLRNKKSVLIAACDTFRSGAVEQLKTHVANFSKLSDVRVDVYEKGYNKDSAILAKDAINYATKEGYDVVLIDTAGRMQNNDPLMNALGKLINTNKPDLILFVGEALVGNECIDQLQKFNKCIQESSNKEIDGIILTKFDTVDENVGAVLSMAHVCGKSVLFLGVGQGYVDLKRVDVDEVTDMLFRGY